MKMVAENPDLYREFLSESKRILFGVRQQVKVLTTGEQNRNEINAIYRGVHTIKGVSATFGLEDVTHITGELEDLLSQMMKAEALNASDRDTLSVLIDRVVGAFDGIVILTHGLLGDFTDGEDVSVRVPVSAVNETITSIRETVRDLFGEEGVHAAMKVIAPSIHRLKRVPVKRAFARSLRIVPGLIERLEKNCRLIVNGSECMVNYEAAVEVNGALVHLLRNAIDHGIEHPDERAANGKDPEGKVTLSISCSNEYLSIVLSDDGRGLDKEKLKAAARSGKMYSDTELENMTETELYRLALTPGFTTATHISDVSGKPCSSKTGSPPAPVSRTSKVNPLVLISVGVMVASPVSISLPVSSPVSSFPVSSFPVSSFPVSSSRRTCTARSS